MREPSYRATPEGLAEIEKVARSGVRSLDLLRADIIDNRYALTFRSSPFRRAAERAALNEMETALNAHRFGTADLTDVDVKFD